MRSPLGAPPQPFIALSSDHLYYINLPIEF
jgi:hypothetical protein